MKKLLTCLLLLSNFTILFAQKNYKTKFDAGFSVEMFGISPGISANLEFIARKFPKSFFCVRFGAGYMPSTHNGVSFSNAYTYNILLQRNLKNNCNPYPRNTNGEWFFETGIGQTYAAYYDESVTNKKYYLSPIIGLRRQVSIVGTPTIFFYKFQLTPRNIANEWELFGGISAGISF